MTATECTGAGGTPVGMGTGTANASCLPDPCASTPGSGIVCCTNSTHDDESEAECEEVTTQADCAANGGTVVQASSCDANPCQVTPPANTAACCVAEGDGPETECKVLSAQACTGLGGTAPGAATCDSNPCGTGSGQDDGGSGDGGQGDGGSGNGGSGNGGSGNDGHGSGRGHGGGGDD